jgi:hypothetical protein
MHDGYDAMKFARELRLLREREQEFNAAQARIQELELENQLLQDKLAQTELVLQECDEAYRECSQDEAA